MDNMFMIATIISIIYLVSKFIEMRFFEKENKPLKILVRDTLLVYFCAVLGFFIIDQLKPIINDVSNSNLTTPVFIDNPEF
jgi:hypothetical protein